MSKLDKLLVILGPTATGKTDLALSLARKFKGELVACDSRQVYRGLDIGTGKEPGKNQETGVKKEEGLWKIDSIKVWMYDVADPNARFTVKDYIDEAQPVVDNILKRGGLPIIVGGTGLYLKALLEGLPNLEVPFDPKHRSKLRGLSLGELQKRLQRISPGRWGSLNGSDQKNSRRLIRAIELAYADEKGLGDETSPPVEKAYKTLKIGLTAPREILNERIDQRLTARVNQGLIEEGVRLYRGGLSLERMRELGLEYRSLATYLSGEINRETMVKELRTKIHQYAKRQLTWFKKERNVRWFNITSEGWDQKVEKEVGTWYHGANDQTGGYLL